jgi:drug/metabolite transporter (DMT)-like permease
MVAPRYWFGLLALVAVWGSSYALIELALPTIGPLEVTVVRIGVGALLMTLICVIARIKLPFAKASLWRLAAVALFGTVAPFLLISWGQTRIDSAVAGVLMAIMPLSVLVFTQLLLPEERLTPWHWLGFAFALGGVIVLMLPDLEWPLAGPMTGHLSVLGGAVCYGLSAVIARSLPPASVWSNSAILLQFGLLLLLPVATIRGLDLLGLGFNVASASVLFLGVFSTSLASALFFYLIRGTSAAFVSNMNFLIPIWAILLGAFALGETVPASIYPALALVLVGLAVAQRPGRGAGRRAPHAESPREPG